MKTRQLLLLLLLAGAVLVFFVLDLGRFVSLAYLKESQATFSALFDQRPVLVAAAYFTVYVLVAALSLPGATILTLAGGATLGLFWGTLLVSFASTIGATLAMLMGRYLLRSATERRFAGRLERFLPFLAAGDARCAVFCPQPADGLDAHEDLDFLLGQPARHARRHAGVRECRHADRAN
jgi:uncharacterized membrane protein YdjX (TVP38/TMEM64 family)